MTTEDPRERLRARRRRLRIERLNTFNEQAPPWRDVDVLGLRLRLGRDVFPADQSEGARLLCQAMPSDLTGWRVWDLGTGTGVVGVTAARRGGDVLATDVLDQACRTAEENAVLNGVEDRIEVRRGDLFAPLHEDERFNLVLFNPPFLDGEPVTRLDIALVDVGHAIVSGFLLGVAERLNPGGAALMAFTDLGDEGRLAEAIAAARLRSVERDALTTAEGRFYVIELKRPAAPARPA